MWMSKLTNRGNYVGIYDVIGNTTYKDVTWLKAVWMLKSFSGSGLKGKTEENSQTLDSERRTFFLPQHNGWVIHKALHNCNALKDFSEMSECLSVWIWPWKPTVAKKHERMKVMNEKCWSLTWGLHKNQALSHTVNIILALQKQTWG